MIIEMKAIRLCRNEKGAFGHIVLDKLAIPESVKVTLLGKSIIPASFDFLGHPNFTEEQAMLFKFKEDELKRQNGKKYILNAQIIYEERIFDVPRNTFDSINGIENSLRNLSDLHKMLRNRTLFIETHKNEKLNEYMLFGCFYLDRFGRIMSVERTEYGKLKTNGDVETYETFYVNNSEGYIILTTGEYVIPTAGSSCPCCGKKHKIKEIKKNPCILIDGKFYHHNCWRNYRRLIEIDDFTCRLVGGIYKDTDYTFEVLPNGYSNDEYYSHIPWFLFHTVDGDIIVGRRASVISIEWQENYKSFDMNELFGTEAVVKWKDGGKCGIYACDQNKVREYLEKVLKTVNPSYSRR